MSEGGEGRKTKTNHRRRKKRYQRAKKDGVCVVFCYVIVGLLHFRIGLPACVPNCPHATFPYFYFLALTLSIQGLGGQGRTGYKEVAFFFFSGNDSYDKTRYNDDDDGRGAADGHWHGRVG